MSIRTKPTIAVDCDDVVANINDAVRQFVNETYGVHHTAEDYKVTGDYQQYWERIWNVSEAEGSERLHRFIRSGRMRHLEPIPRALETLVHLKQRYTIVMITARTVTEVEFTYFWLQQYAPEVFDQVTFLHLWDDDDKKATKGQVCQTLGAEYLIDDNYSHCQIASECGVKTLLFGDYGWNRQVTLHDNMTRVGNWVQVREYFDEQ